MNADACYAALSARDRRYDGRFFVGVRSTGVYCRPVCPARTPARRHVVFFPSAAAAAEAGFRACLRCRPETAPGTPAWRGTAATVQRALRLIDDGALDRGSVGQLAGRLGIGERQLRKLFRAHLGASPSAVALTRRLHAARLLLRTDLPIGDVATLAGFGSVRRFNDAVQRGFGRTPTALRASGAAGVALSLDLWARPPFDAAGLLAWLAPRAIPGLERVEGTTWRHRLPEGGEVVARIDGERVRVEVPASAAQRVPAIVRGVRRLLDLDLDPEAVHQAVPFVPAGLRLPGAFDPFVTGVRILLGQQVSVAAATTLAGRLVERFGYPEPAVLADADVAPIGLPAARARCVRAFAAAFAEGRVQAGPDLDATVGTLTALPGIGPWTAHMLAMRVLGEPDAFPATDLVLRRRVPDPRAAEAWRPFRAYAAMALWRTT